MNACTNTSNFDNNLPLQTLMNRLQINPNQFHNNNNNKKKPFLSQSLEDLLLTDLINDATSSSSEDEDGTTSQTNLNTRTRLAKEESKIEKEIIRTVLSGKIDTLKPNSGQAITIGDHHACIGFHEEAGSDYRVWEWHGHVVLFDKENGLSFEYIYGNYFEWLKDKDKAASFKKVAKGEDEEERVKNLGLRELIGGGAGGDSGPARILHRNINAGSTKV